MGAPSLCLAVRMGVNGEGGFLYLDTEKAYNKGMEISCNGKEG